MIDRTVVGTLLRRPDLWPEALRFLVAASPDAWWRRAPYLPRPEGTYWSWRVATAYGSADSRPVPEDIVGFLEWRRVQRRAT